jgi:hypothetical protein
MLDAGDEPTPARGAQAGPTGTLTQRRRCTVRTVRQAHGRDNGERVLTLWRGVSRPGRLLELASRLGYAARGAVYLGMGVIVLAAAFGLAPRAKGAKAMMAAWADWPIGQGVLIVMAGGLWGFAAWRALQAVYDADGHGRSAKAIVVRLGQAVSGVVYAALAMSAVTVLDAFEDIDEADEERAARAFAARVLGLPYGDAVLLCVGAALIGVGVGNILQGLLQDFAKRLTCDEALCRRVAPLARLGYGARGLATLPTGAFLMRAGWETRSGEAHSWGGALQVIAAKPFGHLALSVVALGLIAFGLFAWVEAAYRRIRPPNR